MGLVGVGKGDSRRLRRKWWVWAEMNLEGEHRCCVDSGRFIYWKRKGRSQKFAHWLPVHNVGWGWGWGDYDCRTYC